MLSNEYYRNYQRQRRIERRKQALNYLGNKCVKCGIEDNLEFDHKDPKTKEYTISNQLTFLSWDKLILELDKCQLLCKEHHRDKTYIDMNQSPAKGEHGRVSSYKYCGPPKCELCKAAIRNTPSFKNRERTRKPPEHGTSVMYSYYKCRCDICKEGQRIRCLVWRKNKQI